MEEIRNSDGKLHCEDGPAIILNNPDGTKEEQWFFNNRKHRIGGPAVDGPNYTEYWLNGQLHRNDGPSIVYHKGDSSGNGVGQELYHLHGVRVSKELVMMKDSEFTQNLYFKEKNVEIRREIIRKFGIERIIKLKNKAKSDKDLKIGEALLLDEKEDYQLLRVRLLSGIYGNYLKMKNPSIGVFHIEGVSNECNTVDEAISWRNHGLSGQPEILT